MNIKVYGHNLYFEIFRIRFKKMVLEIRTIYIQYKTLYKIIFYKYL